MSHLKAALRASSSEEAFDLVLGCSRTAAAPPASVAFITPPENRGQAIEVSYSSESDEDGYLYKKVVNKNTGKTTYYEVHAEDVRGKWQPWNSEPKARFKKMGSTEQRSRFEEGKPADPTENMSAEDAKKWKEENERNKDRFKTARELVDSNPEAAFDAILATDKTSREDPWVVAHELLEQGLNHPAFLEIASEWNNVIKALKKGQQEEANLMRHGIGMTESKTLLDAHVMPKLKSFFETVGLVYKQIEERTRR